MFARKNQTRNKTTGAAALVMGLLAAGGQPCSGAIIYNVFDLGAGQAYGINDSGQITGAFQNHAFRYTGTPGVDGAMVDLGTLPGETNSTGHAINAAGQVAGSPTINSPGHAFRTTATGTINAASDLGTLGGTNSQGYGINDAGQVAGTSRITGNTSLRAFRYTGTPGAGGSMANLGTLGGLHSEGSAINTAGQVTGYSFTSGNASYRPFRTSATGTITTASNLGGLGGTAGRGHAINDAGQVAGESYLVGDSSFHAFRTTATGTINAASDLGTLGAPPGHGAGSRAYGINNSGQVVGQSSHPAHDFIPHAFLYSGAGPMQDLNSLIPSNSGWTLYEARDINNNGQIVGYGTHNGQTRAFLLTPQPTLYAVLLGGTGGGLDGPHDTFAVHNALEPFTDVLQNVHRVRDRAEVDAALADIKTKIQPGDSFLFFYSGHGGWDESTVFHNDEQPIDLSQEVIDDNVDYQPSDQLNTGDEYLGIGNGEEIYDDDLADMLRSLPNSAGIRKLVVTGQCFGGGLWGPAGNVDDTGDLDEVPNSALLAVPEGTFGKFYDPHNPSYGDLRGRTYVGVAFEEALKELATQSGFSLAELRRQMILYYRNANFPLEGALAGMPWFDTTTIRPTGDLSLLLEATADFDQNAKLVPEPALVPLAGLLLLSMRRRSRASDRNG